MELMVIPEGIDDEYMAQLGIVEILDQTGGYMIVVEVPDSVVELES